MSGANGLSMEVKNQFDNLQRTIHAFQLKNNELERQVKKGFADVVTKGEVARINTAIDRMSDQVDRMAKKAARPVISETRVEAALETKANATFASWHGHTDASRVAGARLAYKAAFTEFVRRGDTALTDIEKKALSVGSAPDGGFYIEPSRSDFIIKKVFETSPLRSLASSQTITSANTLKFPIDRDEVPVTWVSETEARVETATPKIGEKSIPVHEMHAQPVATQNLLDDSGIDIEMWLSEKVSDKFGRGENTAFVTGDGVSKPRGFLTLPNSTADDYSRPYGAIQYVGTGVSGGFAAAAADGSVMPADVLLQVIYQFKEGMDDNLTWALNRTTLGSIRQFKDKFGNYIVGTNLVQGTGVIETVFGLPVKKFADMPQISAGSLSIALANWKKAYMIVDRSGIRQLRDPFTRKPFVIYDTFKRVGGDVIDTDAIKFVKFG